ncbi:MAG TPA: N-acetyltransferase [Anaerolineae bacterium]|nr:N-acetyltransferase [Anaerolineae bacterium]
MSILNSTMLRVGTDKDAAGIEAVLTTAFGRREEAALVANLRAAGACAYTLVAVVGEEIVGCCIFSPVTIEPVHMVWRGLGLGPIGVLPAYQKRGVGGKLIRASLPVLADKGYHTVVLLGHPSYYPRFGFVPGHELGLATTYDVPAEVFMAQNLRVGVPAVVGTVHYHPVFAGV